MRKLNCNSLFTDSARKAITTGCLRRIGRIGIGGLEIVVAIAVIVLHSSRSFRRLSSPAASDPTVSLLAQGNSYLDRPNHVIARHSLYEERPITRDKNKEQRSNDREWPTYNILKERIGWLQHSTYTSFHPLYINDAR